MPAAWPATISRSSSPTYKQTSGGKPNLRAASNMGSGCGLACGVVSPLTMAPALLNKGMAWVIGSVKRELLLVTTPQLQARDSMSRITSSTPSNNLLFDLGPHFLDQALQLFGEPEEFYKIAPKLRENSKIIDHFTLMLTYKDKVVRLKSTMIAAKSDIRYRIHTDKGTFHFYEMGEQEHQLLAGMKPDDKNYEYKRDQLFHYYNHHSFPVIVINNQLLGGYSDLIKAHSTSKLHDMCSKIGLEL